MKHYTQAQLNAISASYTRKRQAEREAEAKAKGLDIVYKYQTVYKTLQGLLNANAKRLVKAVESAIANAEKRVSQLVKCGCKSETLTNTIKELETLQKMNKK